MSNMRDINSEIDRSKGYAVILHKITHPGPIRTNRGQLLVLISIMVVFFMLGSVFFPGNQLLPGYEIKKTTHDIYNVPMNPILSAEINALKGQVVGLISGSIESKIRTLEESIRSGAISSKDLGTIQDLKNDVKVLITYSATGAGQLIAIPEKPVQAKQNVNTVTTDQLIKEVSHLKNLLYLILASCGLMFAAFGGIWLQKRYRLADEQSVKYRAGSFHEKDR